MKADIKTKLIQVLKNEKEIPYGKLASYCRSWRRKVSYAERELRKMRQQGNKEYIPQVQVEKTNGAIVKYKWIRKV